MSWRERVCKVRVIFIGHRDMDAGWPHHLFDIDSEAKRLKGELLKLQKKLKNIEFYGWDLVTSEFDAERLLPELEDADGLLTIPLTQEFADSNWTPHPPLIQFADLNKPMIVYSKPFSTYWDMGSVLSRMGKVVVIDSNKIEDIIPALEAMRAATRMKSIRVLLVKDYEYPKEYVDPRFRDARWTGPSYFKRIKEIFGIEFKRITSEELIKAYNNVQIKDAEKVATEVINKSKGLKEPSQDDVLKAARMYLAIKDLLNKYDCNAFTIDCLSYIRSKMLPASPCLAISKLNDEGIPSACEADIEALITMILGHVIAERPVYMGDPVLDEEKNVVIIAHCTSATKMLGYDGKQFPYLIRTHTESWRDVGLEVEMAPGEVTVLKLVGTYTVKALSYPFAPLNMKFDGYNLIAVKTNLLGSLKHEWGCRTKAVLKLVGDPEEFKRNFYCEHKIICYGDWIKQLKALAQFLKIGFVNKLYLPID